MSWTLEYILGLPIFETIAIEANNMPNIQSVSTLTISGQGLFWGRSGILIARWFWEGNIQCGTPRVSWGYADCDLVDT